MSPPPEEIRDRVQIDSDNTNRLAAFAALASLATPTMARLNGHHGWCGLCRQPIVQGDGVRERYLTYGKCHGRCAMVHEGPQPKSSRKQRKKRKEGQHGEGQDDRQSS